MMGTRAAAFAGKIFNLKESLNRIQNGTMPQPTCIDLANMLKYFCQVLHDFRDFKDIENVPLYASEKKDQVQLIRTLPCFDYCGLYKTLAQFVDVLPLIPQPSNGFDQLGTNLLMLFKCLVPFLDQSNMETMPYLVATLFMSLPQSFHKDILDTLCFNLLPFTIDQQQKNTAAMLRRVKSRQQKIQQKQQRQQQQIVGGDRPVHCMVRIEDLNKSQDDNDGLSQNKNKQADDSNQDLGIEMETTDSNNKTIDESEHEQEELDDEYALLSVTSILMISFHYIQEPAHNSQLIECLMKLKSNVFEDLLFVIAYGTTRARCPATELLFRYWPDICPSQQDRKNNSQANSKLKHVPWKPTKCQNKNCSFTAVEEDEAVKMCLDFKISITLSELPPPMLVCLDCVDSIYKQQLTSGALDATNSGSGGQQTNSSANESSFQALEDYSSKFIDLLLPMERVSKLCENKKCKSQDRMAIGTCFDIECANYNGKKPIRYCKQCFLSIHEPCESNNYDVTLQNHIRHSSIKLTIMESEQNINNFVEAIISLLKEAAPADKPSKDSERHLRSLMGPMSQFSIDNKDNLNIATEEKQLISQYGIWLMTGLCKTVDKLSDELLGRLLGMLFQWFHFTACLPDDQAGSALEKLKGECIKGWIMEVKNKRLDVFISCLLPHPIDCSKIGGHWEVWPDTAYQIKEGFKRLLCLVPYDIITDDVWDEIMPYWMECFRHEVPENELNELKILLSKVFDPELSPLGFETKQMYNFISSRFEDPTNTNQEQTLYWLQIITMLEIPIPIDFLYKMLSSGVKSLAEIRANELSRLRLATRMSEINGRKSESAGTPTMMSSSMSMSMSASRSSGAQSDGNHSGDSDDEDDDDSSNDSGGGSSGASSPAGSAGTLSVAEDDVMLPTGKGPGGQGGPSMTASSSTTGPSKHLTQQERQARARAAFSAKLMQHANMLNAERESTSSQPTQSTPTATTSQQHLGLPLGQTTKSQTSTSLNASPSANIAASSHQHPLKSTTSSTSVGGSVSPHQDQQQQAGGKGPSRKHRDGKKLSKGHSKSCKDRTGQGESGRTGKHKLQKQSTSSSSERPKLRLNLSPVDEYANMSKIDNNLVCYILMMDILLKQLDLQEINSHRGLDTKEAQQAIELLNSIISTPWIGKHTCCDSMPLAGSGGSPTPGAEASGSSAGGKQAADQQNNKHPQQQTQYYQHPMNYHSFGHCAQGFEQDQDYNFETCVFCEIISTFHQLAMSLVEFFSPVIEVSICEVSQDAANGEFDGQPDYSRIGLDHLGPIADKDVKFNFHNSVDGQQQHQQQQLHRLQQQQDPSSPFSPSYLGPILKPEVLNGLPKELQLAYNLLVQFHQYQTPDIVSQLLQIIKLISLHSQVLSKAAKNNPQFISWCQHNMLVNKLWSLCQLESSEIARTCVPLLLHCVTLPWGVRLFRDLVERDFNSENWLSRFRAVERVVTIAYFCEPSTIKNSTLLQSTMASAFCYVVRCLDDIEAIVAQRALVSLEMMKTSSLKLLLWCLEVQFDYIIIDRPMLLRSVFQLYNHLRDRRFLTWEFFLNRFDTIFLEAQIYLQQTGEIPSFTMQDLKNTNTKSEIYQKKIGRAKEALQETHHSRSLSSRFHERRFTASNPSKPATTTTTATAPGGDVASGDQTMHDLNQQYKQSIRLQQKMQRQSSGPSATTSPPAAATAEHSPSVHLTPLGSPAININDPNNMLIKGGDVQSQHGEHQPKPGSLQEKCHSSSPMKRVLQHGRSTSSRYQSVAYLTSQSLAKRQNSKFMSNLAMQSVPPLMSLPDKLHQHLPNSFVDDGSKLNEIAQENHVFGVVHRACDEDRDTNHSLIFLLMQFFSKPDPSHPQTMKTLNRSHQIVLRHLNILMGYSVARKNFLIPATNLRLLPVFNAFLTSLPKVLDFNYTLGTILLDTCLPVLIYSPAPDDIQYDSIRTPTYSLWLLNPLMRQSWLMSVMTFLYKYQFGQPHLKNQVYMLMWIVINTLESHLKCTTLDAMPVDRLLANLQQPTPSGGASGSTNNLPVSQAGSPASHQNHYKPATHHSQDTQEAAVGEGRRAVSQEAHEPSESPARMAATTKTISSPSRVEAIEMTQVTSEPGKPVGGAKKSAAAAAAANQAMLNSSSSTSSLKQHDHQQQQQVAKAGFLTGKPQMTKADTSDSLGVRAKLFHTKRLANEGGQQSSSPSSPPPPPKTVAKPSGASSDSEQHRQQQVAEVGHKQTPSEQQPSAEERLLPIGIQQPGSAHQKVKQMAVDGNLERLLPIGYGGQTSSASLTNLRRGDGVSASSSGGQIDSFKSSDPSTPSPKGAGGPSNYGDRPLPGLRGNLTQSLIHGSTQTKSTLDQQPSSPASCTPSTPIGKKGSSRAGKALECEAEAQASGSPSSKVAAMLGSSAGTASNKMGRFGPLSGARHQSTSHSDGKQSSRDQPATPARDDSSEQTSTASQPAPTKSTSIGTFVASGGGGVGAGGIGRKGKTSKFATKEYNPAKQAAANNNTGGSFQPSHSSPSVLTEQLAILNRHSNVQEFSDKDLSMCLVILETFIHHEPSMAAQLLPNILRLVTRCSSSSNAETWQTGSNVHLVGGSMFVARQFIRVALHDLMENNIFHQIFTSNFTGFEFYKSMATALADFTDLNQLAPLSKLFEDLNRQKNLPAASSLMTILENVATYFECIITESTTHSVSTWNQFILNWENFLRKLILALPRYSGSSIASNIIISPNIGRLDGQATGSSALTSPIGGANQAVTGGATAGSGAGGQSSLAAAVGAGATSSPSGQTIFGSKANPELSGAAAVGPVPSSCSMIMAPIMRIILSTTKISHLASCKTIVDPYSKIISYTVLNSQFKYEHLLEINHNCCRLYTRDREKYLIQRTIAYELVQVLKFRFFILEENLLILLLFVLQDVGGTLAPKVVIENLKIDRATLNQADSYITNVSECLRQHIGDLLEFITDVHAISRINDNLIGSRPSSINRDSFGGHVKAAISQYLALEISLTNAGDNRTILRYLPWLYNSPPIQQGPREFIDCVSHIRQLSWIILGSLQHSALMRDHNSGGSTHHLTGAPMTTSQHSSSAQVNCQPIPIDKNSNVADYVQVILAGFAEQSKESVLHMSGLFHAFLLCQLWTMYCENICGQHPANSEQYRFCQSTLDDFWSKITPGVLRLVGHSRVMSEMVSTHFLQLIESLIESNSSVLIKYLPLWNSVFYSYRKRNKSGNLAIRLQKCIEWQPPDLNELDVEQNKRRFINWLEKVQYKMSHIEIQSSQATPFYLS